MTNPTEPLAITFASRADQILVGDITADLPVEVDYIVQEVTRQSPRLAPTEILAAGGWVSLVGDTGDGYYQQWYGDKQDYYAAPDQMIAVVREVSRFVPLTKNPAHGHTTDDIIGYAVRETIRNGEVLRTADDRVGVDVAVVECGTNYTDALRIAKSYRDQPGGYAVADPLYACGCRGGQR